MLSILKDFIWKHGIIKSNNEDIQFEEITASLLKRYQLNNPFSITSKTQKSNNIEEYLIEDNSYNTFLEPFYLKGKIHLKKLTVDKSQEIISEDTFSFNSKSQQEELILSRIFTRETKGISCTKICVSCNPLQRFMFYLDTFSPSYMKAAI